TTEHTEHIETAGEHTASSKVACPFQLSLCERQPRRIPLTVLQNPENGPQPASHAREQPGEPDLCVPCVLCGEVKGPATNHNQTSVISHPKSAVARSSAATSASISSVVL